jgi:hypothetical protein
MSPEDALALQGAYVIRRWLWVHDPENGLTPWPKHTGRPPKRRPEPGTLDQQDAELG